MKRERRTTNLWLQLSVAASLGREAVCVDSQSGTRMIFHSPRSQVRRLSQFLFQLTNGVPLFTQLLLLFTQLLLLFTQLLLLALDGPLRRLELRRNADNDRINEILAACQLVLAGSVKLP